MNKIVFVCLLIFSTYANASTAFASQFSHFAGGLLGTLLAAYVIVRFVKKYRDKAILWAALLSTAYAFIDQTREFIFRGKFWGQTYDFFSHTLGTLLAVYVLLKIIKLTGKKDVAVATKQDDQLE